MLFTFCTVALLPVLAAAESTRSGNAGNIAYHQKLSGWMLRPLAEKDDFHRKPTRETTGSHRSVADFSDTWYFIQNFYSSTGTFCSQNDIIMKNVFATNYCFVTGPSTSVTYVCLAVDNCFYYEFTDTKCMYGAVTYGINLNMCQAGDADDDGYVTDDGNQFTSQILTAQQGLPQQLPGNSTTLSYYQADNCDPNSLTFSQRLAYPNRCYNNFDGENRTSTQYLEPNLLSYKENGCDSMNIVGSVPYPPGMCQAGPYNPAYFTTYKLVLNHDEPVIQTLAPTFMPTSGPKSNFDAIVGTTVAGFSAMAVLNTLLFFFQPPQSTSSSVNQVNPPQAEKPSEF